MDSPQAQPTRGRSSTRGGPSKRGHGHAFKVGPAHAPRDAYLGKAKKIKADLIDRARIKKQFAKTLKKEGLTSERLGGRGGKGGKGKGKDEGSGIPTDERGRKVRDGGWGSRAGVKEDANEQEGKSKREEEQERGNMSSSSEVKVIPAPTATKSKPTTSTDATSQSQPLPSLRTLKREAYALHHSPSSSRTHPAPGSTSSPGAGVHPSRTRTAAAKASVTSSRAGEVASSLASPHSGRSKVVVGGVGKRTKGQPNMGARMDVLLEKIKRSKAV